MNRPFRYALNNPLIVVDPTGLLPNVGGVGDIDAGCGAGPGTGRLSCCDGKCWWHVKYHKICMGLYVGAQASVGPVVFYDRKDCPYGYQGTFLEFSAKILKGFGGCIGTQAAAATWGAGVGGGIKLCRYIFHSVKQGGSCACSHEGERMFDPTAMSDTYYCGRNDLLD